MIDRMFRAAQLERSLYQEVENDRTLTREALLVVIIGSLAAGIGLGLAASPILIIVGTLAALLSWGVYAGIAYYVGTRWLAEPSTHADWGELLRVVGYANSPRALLVLVFIPIIGNIVAVLVALWVLVATIIAVKEALDYSSTGRAVATAAIAWLAELALLAVIAVVAG